MSGRARVGAGRVVCLPPGAGRPNDWLRFWRLPAEEVRFTDDGRVELPLLGYVRLKLHPVWAPTLEQMAGLFGLEAGAVLDGGDGWALVPVPNAAMAVREGRVLLWCVEFVPELVDLEEMVLGTRHRQWHLFREETQRYRRSLGYSPAEEGELLYGGAVQGKAPYGCRVVLPTRLLRPEEALSPVELPAAPHGWALPGMPPVEEQEAAPAEAVAWHEEPGVSEGAGLGLEEGAAPAAPVEEAGDEVATWQRREAGEERQEVPARRRVERRPLPLRQAVDAIARAAASLVMRPEEPEEEGQEVTDYLQVTGGVRTFLWALGGEGLAVRGAPVIWARGRAAGLVVELSQEAAERTVVAAVEKAAKSLRTAALRVRRVGPRLWEVALQELPVPRPEGAAVAVAAVPIGRREEQGAAPWVALADLGSPGGLLLDASPQDEARFLSWWVAAASLALPGMQVWAQEGTAAERWATRRFPSASEAIDALYDEVVGRFEEGRRLAPLLVVMRLPDEREREVAATLGARGPEVGCYLVLLGPAEGCRLPAWVRVREGMVEAEVVGGRARLLPPQVEGAVEEAPTAAAEGEPGAGWHGAGYGSMGASAGAAGLEGETADEGPLPVEAAAGELAEGAAAEMEVGEAAPALSAAEESLGAAPEEEGEEEGELEEGEGSLVPPSGPFGEQQASPGRAVVAEEEAEEEDEEEGETEAGGGPVAPPLEVAVLGPLRTSLSLDRQAARELLALLVLREGEIGRDEAAALLEEGRLGAGVGVAYALNKLRLAVKALRRACEEAGLPRAIFGVQRSGQVTMARGWARCDLWEALELATALAAGMGGEGEARRLADLVRGPILEGEAYSWVEQEAARVERRLKGLLLRGARRLAADGRHELAAELAAAARRLDPLDEAALRQELESLLAQGKLVQARGVYRSFLRDLRRLLEDEEAMPEEETVELARRLEVAE